MCSHAAGAVLEFAQGLGDHGLQRFGEHRADHFLFFGGEHVNDPVDGLGGAGGMQRAEHQVACFGSRHGQANGFQVAHFAHQNRVRVFTQRRLQRCRKRQRHRPHFALVDQALLGFVHELDRVFHREDVAVLGFVQVVDHGGQRGRFARARGAGHQHQATGLEGQVAEDLGRVELLQRQDLGGNGPEHGGRAAVLVERVDAETGQAFDFKREVNLEKFLVLLALSVVHDVVHHRVHGLVVQCFHVDAPHVAVDSNHGWQSRRQVQVGGLVLDAERQQLGDVHGVPSIVWYAWRPL